MTLLIVPSVFVVIALIMFAVWRHTPDDETLEMLFDPWYFWRRRL